MNAEEKRYKLALCEGVEGPSIYLNEYRIAGPKPWGGGRIAKEWDVSLADIQRAIPQFASTCAAAEETKP